MCIKLPNGIRIRPKRDEDGNIMHLDEIRAMGEIPAGDIEPHRGENDECFFVDTMPVDEIPEDIRALRDSFRNFYREAVQRCGWPQDLKKSDQS